MIVRLVRQGIGECRTSRVCFHAGAVIKIQNILFCFIVVRSEAQVPGYFGNKTWERLRTYFRAVLDAINFHFHNKMGGLMSMNFII